MDSTSLASTEYALNTLYILLSGAFVMWMAAGFAMLEAGLVRSKNTTEILTKNIVLFALACIAYLIVGYNLMYGAGGSDSFADDADFFFQSVFVATAMSIVSGAVAERMKLLAFFIFAVVLSAVIYPYQGSWSWGGGFLAEAGFVDFAGSGIVHMAGAAAALAGVLLLGPRLGKYKNGKPTAIPGANMPLAALGTLILWFGWFGFNGGSQLAIHDIDNANAVARVFVNTNTAAAAGAVGALLMTVFIWRKADLTMIVNGVLAGLVAITAQPLTPDPIHAAVFGFIAGLLVVISIITLDRLRIDDPVGALSVHGVVGLYGLMLVPFTDSNATWSTQLLGAGSIFGWTFITSLAIWYLLKVTIGIRVSEEQEYLGGDISECGIEAYPEFTGSTKR
ncbi:ammonium transporter [Idiomarina fontislapidosi]|uniref:Ammonium transporter n=1 Tax=Idiomarina fontislapidosi TaxID=263723 RepID=A0A432Y8B8_9GAMM|nr:ammonium transporter [Idiomarina fontislapidosi]PYE33833.1 ammonium transporter [Idiomarina fontislapidosi]RUO57225.1 ammonium transporter [Idiomarina fontislapidosi]|tara:strand:+ start:8968 stop:10146 length:1179 start_codon:yes stop_codon:yes gene_type:complete